VKVQRKDSLGKDSRATFVRELAEDVRKIARRAEGIGAVGVAGFQGLSEGEQAELLHNLSCVRRWAETVLRRLEECEETGRGLCRHSATEGDGTE